MGADVGNGHVHTRGDFLLRHTRSGKTRAHRVHVFAHLHDMPVGIEKAHDALAPAMFEYGMHVFYTVRRFQPFRESVKVVLLKIEFSVLPAVGYGFGAASLPNAVI